jgi:hypothetical protein
MSKVRSRLKYRTIGAAISGAIEMCMPASHHIEEEHSWFLDERLMNLGVKSFAMTTKCDLTKNSERFIWYCFSHNWEALANQVPELCYCSCVA